MKFLKNIPLLLVLAFVACGDPCDDVVCGPNGTCVEGDCLCNDGYSGANCQINICDSVNCNNGNCDPVTGDCTCDDGYEGGFCDTEIRAKYFGTYSGSFEVCLAELIDLIDTSQVPEEFLMALAIISADPDNINNVIITQTNALTSGENIIVNPSNGSFNLPLTSTTVEIPNIPFPVSITVTGNGEFIDENSFIINLNIITPLIPAISCSIIMTRA